MFLPSPHPQNFMQSSISCGASSGTAPLEGTDDEENSARLHTKAGPTFVRSTRGCCNCCASRTHVRPKFDPPTRARLEYGRLARYDVPANPLRLSLLPANPGASRPPTASMWSELCSSALFGRAPVRPVASGNLNERVCRTG